MKLGLALSGGGIRGIAHAGVLKALEENNIKIDAIGGTSSGSLIATLYALGYSPYYIYILFKRYASEITQINAGAILSGLGNFMKNKKIPILGLKTGNSIEKAFDELASRKGIKNIGEITKMPIVIPTVDIGESKEYIFTNNIPKSKKKDNYITDISIGKAVRASSSFPAVFCPCEYESHKFLDGGALDNVPVVEVRKQGVDKVIAVNFKADDIDESSNMMDVAMRTIDIMGNKISEESLKNSDYILTVRTDKTGLLDTNKLDSCFEYGYKTVIDNIKDINSILK